MFETVTITTAAAAVTHVTSLTMSVVPRRQCHHARRVTIGIIDKGFLRIKGMGGGMMTAHHRLNEEVPATAPNLWSCDAAAMRIVGVAIGYIMIPSVSVRI